MTPPNPLAGIDDRYRVAGELGTGGMATVYRADDLKHGRPVAIKVLRPELGVVLGASRFLQEIRTTAALQHPNRALMERTRSLWEAAVAEAGQ